MCYHASDDEYVKQSNDNDNDPSSAYKYFRILYPFANPEVVMNRIIDRQGLKHDDSSNNDIMQSDTLHPPSAYAQITIAIKIYT